MTKTRARVLIADDEPTVRELVKRILKHNYIIDEVANGADAVDAARSLVPDIILMDIMMPEMDGLSACYAIKQDEATRHIPVVMLSAITHELNQRLSQAVMGASGYITKPFSPHDLLTTVADVLLGKVRTEPTKPT